ncbi:MAG: 30S ribosomal protein S16 [Candidatus Staskawiczbacteria bacterium]|nr:30S ribosomal protein S16 [Candidatus Staskawiczbacteria bacterium]
MLTIRLTRKGKKNQPFFKVVVIDKRRSSKGGRAVEDLGYVDPLKKRKSFKKDRILYWISKGAKPTPTIHNYLVSEKIIDAKKINLFKKSKKPAVVAPATPASAQGSGEAKPATAPTAATPAPAPAPAVEAPKEAPKA